MEIYTTGSEETEALGEKIGKQLRGGEVIELVSDLGGGKTTLVRGIAAGFGSRDRVSSPTFTISKVYTAKDKRIVHYDFYRLPDAGLMFHEISEELEDKSSVVIVEWADVVKDVLPDKRLHLEIHVVEDNRRKIKLKYPTQLEYLVRK